jgi:hypothetical protein
MGKLLGASTAQYECRPLIISLGWDQILSETCSRRRVSPPAGKAHMPFERPANELEPACDMSFGVSFYIVSCWRRSFFRLKDDIKVRHSGGPLLLSGAT